MESFATTTPAAINGPAQTAPLQTAASHRVGIVGAGYIAQYHLAILRELPGIEVIGACDPNRARVDALCREFMLPFASGSVDELLAERKPDVLHILVPPAFHYEVAASALKAGVHVLVEKPMALDAKDCEQLIGLAHTHDVRLGVNHNAIHHPAFVRLQRDLAARRLGTVEHVVSVNNLPLAQLESGEHDHWMFREPANVLFEQAPHPLSQICAVLGRVSRVATVPTGERRLRGGRPFYSSWHLTLQCERGTAQMFLSFGRSFPEAFVHVIGSDGAAHLDLINNLYTLDRPTMYFEPVDRYFRALRHSWQTAWGGYRGVLNYVFSTLRLRGRTDPYYLSMKGSIAAFYQTLDPRSPFPESAINGWHVIEGLGLAAAQVHPREDAAAAGQAAMARIQSALTKRKEGEILVLGGTGFIGRRVVAALVHAGHPVRLLARRPSLAADLASDGNVAISPGDIRNPAEVREAVRGCRAVIHLVSGAPTSWPEFERLFIDGTRNVAEACLEDSVGQLLFASSIAAYYLGSPRVTITEETPLDPYPHRRTTYSRAKIACERLLGELHARRGLPVTIFRPGVVVGEGGPVEHSGVGYWPNRSHCVSWGWRIHHGLPFVLADDVAAALVNSIGREGLGGKSFNLAGDVRLSAAEYVQLLRAESGRDIHLHRQTIIKWLAVDVFKWFIKVLARKPDNAFPSRRDLVSRSLASPFDCTQAKKLLDWKPVADRDRFIELGIRRPLGSQGRE